jgi:hypothetical protein
MKIISIIKQYLCENGFLGLTDKFGCYCELKNLFGGCDCIQSECVPYPEPENEIEPEPEIIDDYDPASEEDEDDLF